MTSLKSILWGSVAAIGLAAGPTLAQDAAATAETPAEGQLVVQSEQQVEPRNYDTSYGAGFGDLGDRNVQELIGTAVASAEGQTIGEVDNFALVGQELAAIVGIGGFLGVGEHQVALKLGDLTWDGEKLVVANFTEDQLREMPEYDEGSTAMLAGDSTLRSGYETAQTPMTANGSQQTADAQDQEQIVVEGDAEMAEADTEVEQTADAAGSDLAQAGQEVEQTAESTMAEAGQEIDRAADSAEAEVADAGQEIDQAADSTEAEVADAGQEVDQAADSAEAEVADAGQEVEQAAEGATAEVAEAGEEVGEAADAAGTEVAQAADQTEQAVDETVDQMAQESEGDAEAQGEVTDLAAGETEAESDIGEPVMAEGGEAADTETTAEPQMAEGETEVTTENADVAQTDADTDPWSQQMDTVFADIADRQVAELIGMEVAAADGESVGEIDNFALLGQDVVAIVGIGGFLGLGEHKVALPLNDMSYDGERLVLSSLTEEQLKEMPEYDEAAATVLPDDSTLRTSRSQ